ncbi:zinc metalloprotease [Pontibacillus yanchengensis Y32]|uniref:Zinc metalloprotease n=1 Tax=Pontibacillus yanchengensis Y32 TaxID=1385514 RepID=A0A0A2TJ84_9BACI|nr:zinc metalloprotease [Pontibacillus yanchengensis Y32]
MPLLKYGTTNIDYEIHHQERSDMKISVDLVNGVEIYAPKSLEDEKLEKLLQKKAPWIKTKLNELNEVEHFTSKKEFVSGEKLPYLGRNYKLKVHREAVNHASIYYYQGKFIATVPQKWSQEEIQQTLELQLIDWYRKHGMMKIKERAEYYQNLLGVTPNSINLRTQHKRWGTCTPKGDIYLNWRIVMAPVKVIDYVMVHELSHLLVAEHNQEFWNTVISILPDYEERKEWLRIHGMELHCIG